MTKTPTQIQREVDEYLAHMRAIERECAGTTTADNRGQGRDVTYERLTADNQSAKRHRWVGKCKKCGRTHRVDGRLLNGYLPGGAHDQVVRSDDGRLLTTAANGTDPSLVWVRCGDHRCLLRRVHEGAKSSKHACGARCTNATGPSCDCRCRGANHGSGLGGS